MHPQNTNLYKIGLCTARVTSHRSREDLTFEVYNLYPDYVYPGRIIRIDIQVEGEPEEDKLVNIEIELHKESELDAATVASIRIFSPKGSYTGVKTAAS